MVQPPPPDSPGTVYEDFRAMEREAGVWRAAGQEMGDAAAAAEGLQLGDYDFSFLGAESGLVDAYRSIQQWATGLLRGAQTNLDNMATELAQVVTTAGAAEEANAGSFDNIEEGQGGNR